MNNLANRFLFYVSLKANPVHPKKILTLPHSQCLLRQHPQEQIIPLRTFSATASMAMASSMTPNKLQISQTQVELYIMTKMVPAKQQVAAMV